MKEPVVPDAQLIGAFLREVLCLLFCAHPTVLPVLGWNLAPLDRQSQFSHITSLVDKCLVTVSDNQAATLNLAGADDALKLIIAYGVALIPIPNRNELFPVLRNIVGESAASIGAC
jgi:hypothetical protein